METTARPQFVGNSAATGTARPTLIESLFVRALRSLKGGSLRIYLPSGACMVVGDTSYPLLEITIHNRDFFKKVFSGGSVGLGESYVDGDWDTPDLTGLLSLLAGNQPKLGPLRRGLSLFTRQMNRLYHVARKNTLAKSRENSQEHYDLSNDFDREFLDQTMT